jgi:surface protein
MTFQASPEFSITTFVSDTEARFNFTAIFSPPANVNYYLPNSNWWIQGPGIQNGVITSVNTTGSIDSHIYTVHASTSGTFSEGNKYYFTPTKVVTASADGTVNNLSMNGDLTFIQVGWFMQGVSGDIINALVTNVDAGPYNILSFSSSQSFTNSNSYYFTTTPIASIAQSDSNISGFSNGISINYAQVGWFVQGINGDIKNCLITSIDLDAYTITIPSGQAFSAGNPYYFSQNPLPVEVQGLYNGGSQGVFDSTSISYASTGFYAQGVDVANIPIGRDPAYIYSVTLSYGNPFVQYASYYFTQNPLTITATANLIGSKVIVTGDISYFQVGWYMQAVSTNPTVDVYNAPIDSIDFATNSISILNSGQSFTDTYQYYVTSSPIPYSVNNSSHDGVFTAPSFSSVSYVQTGWYAQGVDTGNGIDLIDVPVTNVSSDGSTQTTITLDNNYSGFTAGHYYWFSPVPLSSLILTYNFTTGFMLNKLPIENGTITKINWGDGTVSSSFSSHTYSSPSIYNQSSIYNVIIQGKNITHLTQVDIYNQPSGLNGAVELLTGCASFGEIGLTDFTNAFLGAINLVNIPSSLPQMTSVTNMTSMFRDATNFNQSLNNWVFSGVTNMCQMFYNATAFNNGDVGSLNWDVANVTDMQNMFYNASSFNQGMSNLDVSKVGTAPGGSMQSMFHGATLFNQDISAWNVSNLQNMSNMFKDATSFNSAFPGSTMGNVTDISYMFDGATSFNQDISDWHVGSVIDMSYMFNGATSFNNGDSGNNSALPINWLTKTSNIVMMDYMFQGATTFNQVTNFSVGSDIGSSLIGIFYDATLFNQDISNWNLVYNDYIDIFRNNINYGSDTYNTMLANFKAGLDAENNRVHSGTTFKGTGLIYNGDLGLASRNALITTYGWTFDGDIYSSVFSPYSQVNYTMNVPVGVSYISNGDSYQLFYNGTAISSILTAANGTVTFSDVNINEISNIRVQLDLLNTTTSTIANTFYIDMGGAVCFKEDSKIVCLINETEVEVPVQDIQLGDLVKTHIHGYKTVVMKGSSKIKNPSDNDRSKNRLYKYTKEQYPEITEDLVITGEHSILVDKLSEQEKEGAIQFWSKINVTDDKYRLPAFVDEKSIPYEQSGTFNIYHIALEHENEMKNYGVYANGLLVESCCLHNLKNKKGMTLIK